MIKRIFKLIKEKRKAPIAKNMYANLFGVIVNLLNQIVLVPLFLLMWRSCGKASVLDYCVSDGNNLKVEPTVSNRAM
mgnify:CR=1 FL=1